MGRKSTLTDKELADAIQRHLDGESIRSIAKSYNIGESSLRARISAQAKAIKHATEQIVSAHDAISALEIPAQITAHSRAQREIALRQGLNDVASIGVAISKMVSSASYRSIEKLGDDELLDGERLKTIMAAGMVSNTHTKLGMELAGLSVREPKEQEPDKVLRIIGGLPDIAHG